MAQPCAAAEGANDISSNERPRAMNTANRIVRRIFIFISNPEQENTLLFEAALVRTQVHQPDAVREEHDQHHANPEYHGWNEKKKKSQAVEPQVHEVGHDQGGLDQRQAHQNRDHQVNFKALVSKKHFDGRQYQQPHPDDREESRGAYGMLVRKFG